MNTRVSKGFTLVELVVAIGIFGILIVIITGVFTRFMIVERHAIAQGQLVSDVRSALESFTKEVRTGFGSTYSEDGPSFTFVNQEWDCIQYRLNSGKFERANVGNVGNPGFNTCDASDFGAAGIFSPLTSSRTHVDQLRFFVLTGVDSSTKKLTQQGMVTLSIEVSSTTNSTARITLQNTVTSRQMIGYDDPN